MANLSTETRKEQVLSYLQAHKDEWVDGPELANERVGGSEGLKRRRELQSEGHSFEVRKHPDPNRDIWQYKYLGYNSPENPIGTITPSKPLTSLKGVDLGDIMPCPRCKGTKHIQDFSKSGRHVMICPNCAGLGYVRR
jgi:hypothetical protein